MSCFGGLMDEYRYLSLDRFDGKNLSSSAFFLSHFHSDHIIGLPEPEFQKLLKAERDIYLYTSDVTKSLLLADTRFKNLEKYIVPLPIEEETVININHDGQLSRVAVTLISAGHCPGSVMFFFEGDEGSVLYTGDFRLPKGSAARIRPFHLFKKRKPIKSVYVDTTFCSANAVVIPKREHCVATLINFVKQWISEDKNNAVRLNLSAKYGYEFLLIALNKALNCKIYCRRKNLYRSLPQVYHILTDKPEFAKIYAGFKTDKFGSEGRPYNFMKITLSTYYFTENALPNQVYERISENTYRFCFSFHSSYSEVCDFVKYLNPDNVYANVIPFCKTPLETVARNLALKCGLKPKQLNHFPVKSISACSTNDVTDEESHPVPHFTHVLKRALPFNHGDDEDTQDYCDRIINKVIKSDQVTSGKCDTVTCNRTFKKINKCISEECDNVQHESTSTALYSTPNVKFTVPSSPNCKAPAESEIDKLHVKLAMGGDSLVKY